MIPHPTRAEMKGDGPPTGPFAALWLMLKQIMGSFGKHGFDFAAAFDAFENRLRDTLLREVIARYNLDRAGAPLNPADFEIVLVKRGRRAEYEIFSKSGRTLVDELNAQARASWRNWFAARRRLAQVRRLTHLRIVSRHARRRITRCALVRPVRRLQSRRMRAFTARRLQARAHADLVLSASRAPP